MKDPRFRTKEGIEAFLAEVERRNEETMREVRRLRLSALRIMAGTIY